MNNKQSFLIAIPAFNGEKYIESAIHSALHQTRPADQIIGTLISENFWEHYAGRVAEKSWDGFCL